MNWTPTRALNDMMPFKAATGSKPNIAGICKWGEKVWIQVEKGDKLGSHICPGQWVGLDDNSKDTRIYWPDSKTVSVQCNIYMRNNQDLMEHLESEDWTFKWEDVSEENVPASEDNPQPQVPPVEAEQDTTSTDAQPVIAPRMPAAQPTIAQKP
jgi:hypothetical protein